MKTLTLPTTPHHPTSPASIRLGERGSALVATIIAIALAATVGTAIYSMVSTSSRAQIGSLNYTNAYYLADAGCQYATRCVQSAQSSTDSCTPGTSYDLFNPSQRQTFIDWLADPEHASPDGQFYTVNDIGQFRLQYPSTFFVHDGVTAKIKILSTSRLLADNSISRTIPCDAPFPDASGTNLPIDGLDPNKWNPNGPVTATADPAIAKTDGTADSQTSLKLFDTGGTPNPALPNMLDVWKKAGELLTYEAQLKVKLGTPKDVMAGLSFRLDTKGNSDVADDNFYGLSYLWCSATAANRDLPEFCGSETSKVYIVLWKQNQGIKTILGKQLASVVTSGLVTSASPYGLEPWATLVVRLQEQFSLADSSVRENMISAFVGVPSLTPKGTIHWDYTKFPAVSWDSDLTGATIGKDCSGGQNLFISDSTFTSETFQTSPRDEVGFHALGRSTAEITDLALRFNFSGGIASACVEGAPGTIKLNSTNDYSASEGDAPITLYVSRANGSVGNVSVQYAITDGTATVDSDYTTADNTYSGTLSWVNGDTTPKPITISVVDDLGFEPEETFHLALSSPGGGAVLGTPNSADITITDNDGVMPCNAWPNNAQSSGTNSLSASLAASACPNRLLVCAVTSELDASSSSFTVTGSYGGQNLTTLRSTNGKSSRQHVWLGYLKEADIAGRSGNTISTSVSAGASRNGSNLYCAVYQGIDQTYPVAGSIANVNSGSSNISFGGPVVVTQGGSILYVSAANGASSTPPTGYLEHWDKALSGYSQAGGSKKIVTTGTEQPSPWALSASERWGLAVASFNPALGGGNNGTIDFATTDYSVNENGGTATITVTRSGGKVGPVTVDYGTANGTATAGTDYTASSGTLSWASGDDTAKSFTIPVINDSIPTGDKTVNLTLTNATGGATLGQSSAVLTIIDDEAPIPGDIAFSAPTYSVNENVSTVTITATRSNGSNNAVGVTYATTSGGTATAGTDYTTKTGTLSWADGDTANKTFTIPILDDMIYEGSETVNLALTNPTGGASLGAQNTAVLTIVDNESPPAGTRYDLTFDAAGPNMGTDGNINVTSQGTYNYTSSANTNRAVLKTGVTLGSSRGRYRYGNGFNNTYEMVRAYTPAYTTANGLIDANIQISVDYYIRSSGGNSSGNTITAELYEYNTTSGVVGDMKGSWTSNSFSASNTTSALTLTGVINNPSFTVAAGNRLEVRFRAKQTGGETALLYGANKSGSNGNTFIKVVEMASGPDTTPPVIGTVSVSPSKNSYTSASPTITATVTEADSLLTSCEYTTNGSTWVAGVLSGSASPYTCTGSPTNRSGALTINVRATSAGGVGTGTAVTRTVDSSGPADGVLTVTPDWQQNTLTWTAATDTDAGLRASNTYEVRRQTGSLPACPSGGSSIYTGNNLTYTDSGRTNGTLYYYRVCAYDAMNQVSTGAAGSGIPGDTTPPTHSGSLTATPISASQINLSWPTASDTHGLGSPAYKLVVTPGNTAPADCSGSTIYSGNNTSYNNTGLAPSTQYAYRVCASDAAGNVSTPGLTATATTLADTTAPTHSGSLSADTSNTSQLILSWQAATDSDSGMHPTSPYKLVQADGATPPSNCTGTALYNSTGLSFTHTGLSECSQHSYRLCAYDVAGNVTTGLTNTFTTHDGTAPSQSGPLTATATSSSTISLSWPAASDSCSGLATSNAYTLRRATGATPPANCSSGKALNPGTTPSYTDSGRTANTQYSYLLCTYDAAGNVTIGPTQSATTLAPPVNVTYSITPGTATSVGADGNTNYTADEPSSSPAIRSMLGTTAANTGYSYRPTSGMDSESWTTLLKAYSPVYATAKTLSAATTASGGFRVRSDSKSDQWRFHIYAYDPAGSAGNKTLIFTSSTETTNSTSTVTVQPTYTGSGTIPANNRLLLLIDYKPSNSSPFPRIYNTTSSFTVTED